MFKEVGKMLGDLQIENNKLKQALTEIKEIANNTYLKYHTKTEYDAVIRLILQKCEVLDE